MFLFIIYVSNECEFFTLPRGIKNKNKLDKKKKKIKEAQ